MFSNNTPGITVSPGASASQANLGINSGGSLNASGGTVPGTFYNFTGNTTSGSGLASVGSTVSNAAGNSTLTQAANSAISASTSLAGLTANQTFGTLSGTTTITATVPGQNVIALTGINMANGTTLFLSGSATQSFVINVTGGGNLSIENVTLIGGLTPANVIFNVLNSGVVLDNNPDTINGIIMDISGMVDLTNNDTVNEEIISGNTIDLGNNSEVEVVQTVPEASTAACFTVGPLSLVAVMLCYKRFACRKQMVVRGFHDPVEGVLGAAKSC